MRILVDSSEVHAVLIFTTEKLQPLNRRITWNGFKWLTVKYQHYKMGIKLFVIPVFLYLKEIQEKPLQMGLFT